MKEVVHCFVVGHWSVTRKVTSRHVTGVSINLVEIEEGCQPVMINNVIHFKAEQPVSVYKKLITLFSKEDDLILDVGSGNASH